MSPEEKYLLEKTYKLSKENNDILRGIRSSNRLSMFLKVFYWVIIVGVAVGAFYFIQPYVDNVLQTYNSLQSDIGNIQNIVNKVSGK